MLAEELLFEYLKSDSKEVNLLGFFTDTEGIEHFYHIHRNEEIPSNLSKLVLATHDYTQEEIDLDYIRPEKTSEVTEFWFTDPEGNKKKGLVVSKVVEGEELEVLN